MPYIKITEKLSGRVLMPDRIVVTGITVLGADGFPLNVKWDIATKLTLSRGDVIEFMVTLTL